MPTYVYKAFTDGASAATGTIVAPTRREALRRLVEEGKNPLDISVRIADHQGPSGARRPNERACGQANA
jgi:type II secretory pathway component PulF